MFRVTEFTIEVIKLAEAISHTKEQVSPFVSVTIVNVGTQNRCRIYSFSGEMQIEVAALSAGAVR
ncbi:MAG: hypothetical protein RMI34_08340 [Chloroherpetonaceae bacterium]|nr:hypothetical protein [Chloroherpetonaceae bacterium]MCS7212080.1 hypothetical protein [Chloroherpetonaceae bacterium]MDW8020067.1 hypothetical protein [Chloroherpetonaceae bacterium]MDW8465837.1 hypothetical protein [Chloroherpetonaceae bacterium]